MVDLEAVVPRRAEEVRIRWPTQVSAAVAACAEAGESVVVAAGVAGHTPDAAVAGTEGGDRSHRTVVVARAGPVPLPQSEGILQKREVDR